MINGLKAVLAVLAVSIAMAGAARAEPLLIRLSYVSPVSNWAPFIVAKKDLARHWGRSYNYRGGPLSGHAGHDHWRSRMESWKLPAWPIQRSGSRSPTPASATCASFRTSSGTEFRATSAPSSSSARTRGLRRSRISKARCSPPTRSVRGVDIAMKAGLRKHGLVDKRDYTVIEAPLP